jgi:hypothetical protein
VAAERLDDGVGGDGGVGVFEGGAVEEGGDGGGGAPVVVAHGVAQGSSTMGRSG